MFRTLRAVLAGLSAVATFYFVFWMPFSFLAKNESLAWLPYVVSALCGILVGVFVWKQLATLIIGFLKSVLVGAVVTGAIGFLLGFFGPMIWAPDANQGPLLGLFITGPMGFLLGAVGGAIYWFKRGRKRAAKPESAAAAVPSASASTPPSPSPRTPEPS
ncbi:MAG: hypothetical protein ACREOU_09125 [Candidatus Eiseniibacteriota bacterium]